MPDAASPLSAPGSRPDLDLRLVRYFTVVAEHLNFARSAAALHLAQPSLSRQIQRLEGHLGVRLLTRTSQGSRLTEAGQAFLPHAQALLRGADEAARTARAAAPPRAITIGYVEDLVITPAVRDLRHRHPDARVQTCHLHWNDAQALPEGRVDALVARTPLPLPTDKLHVTVLYDEPRVLVVPAFHRLAGKDSVTPDDLAEEALVPCSATGSAWSGPVVNSFEDKLELVGAGEAVGVLPAGDRRSTLREDLVTVPVKVTDPYRVVLATRSVDPNPLVGAFRTSARAHLRARA